MMTKRITVYNKIHVTMLYSYNKNDKWKCNVILSTKSVL